jgi:uncharacterized membrane protein YeaQ/YmgE (transglycosylase-associated protein family)
LVITLGALIVWIILAAIVGFIGEVLARRRAPFGIVGAIVVGFIAMFLIVGVLGIHFAGDPTIYGVPIFTSILVAAIIVLLWSAFAYRHAYGYYTHYYRRGGYVRRPRRRWWYR